MTHTHELGRSLRWALAMNWGERGVTTLATLVLAAILGPREFGTVAVATAYIAFLELFLEQGVGAAIVQREELDAQYLDAAFWMNVAWSGALGVVSIALSGWWARVNDLPSLELIVDALSTSLILRGLAVVQEAVLEREKRFRELAIRCNVAAVAGAAVGAGLAWARAGVWALVFQQLITSVISVGLVWRLSGWRPRLRFSPAHARRLLSFSLHVFGGNLAVFMNRRMDAIIIGLYFGPRAVGLYRLAARVVDTVLELTVRPVQLIALSHFSRLQGAPNALRETFCAAIRMSGLLAVPALLALVGCSDYVIAMLGPAWSPAADAMKLLCVAGIGRALTVVTGPMLQALAKPHLRTLAIGSLAVVSVPTLVIAAWLLRAAPVETQVLGMAAASAAVFLGVFVPISVAVARRVTGISVWTAVRGLLPSFAAGAAALAAVSALTASGMLIRTPPFVALAVVSSTAFLCGGSVLLAGEAPIRTRAWIALRRVAGRAPVTVQPTGSTAP